MKFKAAATKLSFWLALFIFAAGIVPVVLSFSFAAGDMQTQNGEVFINRFDDWDTGNPRVSFASNDDLRIWRDGLGGRCGHVWQNSTLGGNDPGCLFDFNCAHTSAEITANQDAVGYYVAGLSCDGNTIAECYVTWRNDQKCDSDTETLPLAYCVPFLKCD